MYNKYHVSSSTKSIESEFFHLSDFWGREAPDKGKGSISDTVSGLSLLNGGLLFQTLSDYSRKYGTLSYVQGIFEYLKMI